MKKILKYILSVVWLTLCCWCFIDFITNEMAFSDSEISEMFYYGMGVLTFPVGYVIVIANYLVSELLRPFFEFNFNSESGVTVLFLLMTSAGYFQWFVLVPKFFERFIFKK